MFSNSMQFSPTSFHSLTDHSILGRGSPVEGDALARREAFLAAATQRRPPENPTWRDVIVPLDGSPYAEHAIPWALQLAARADVPVRLLHVHERMGPSFHGRRQERYREFDRLLRKPMEEYMADMRQRVARATGASVTTAIVTGRRIPAVPSEMIAGDGAIVVLATRGRSVLGRAIAGSSLDAMLRERGGPILHVRGYPSPVDLTARPSLHHGLVATDGSAESLCVLPAVASISKLTDSRQSLVRVTSAPSESSCGDGNSSVESGGIMNNLAAGLDEIAQQWRRRLPKMEPAVIWSDKELVDAILALANARDADFIALATRPRSRMRRLFSPGVFDQLVRRAEIPVLVVSTPPE